MAHLLCAARPASARRLRQRAKPLSVRHSDHMASLGDGSRGRFQTVRSFTIRSGSWRAKPRNCSSRAWSPSTKFRVSAVWACSARLASRTRSWSRLPFQSRSSANGPRLSVVRSYRRSIRRQWSALWPQVQPGQVPESAFAVGVEGRLWYACCVACRPNYRAGSHRP